jgi:hypothetical protein
VPASYIYCRTRTIRAPAKSVSRRELETPCITDSWRAIFLIRKDIPPGSPLRKIDRYLAGDKSRLRGDQYEAKRLDDSLFLTLAWFMRTELAVVTQQIQDR